MEGGNYENPQENILEIYTNEFIKAGRIILKQISEAKGSINFTRDKEKTLTGLKSSTGSEAIRYLGEYMAYDEVPRLLQAVKVGKIFAQKLTENNPAALKHTSVNSTAGIFILIDEIDHKKDTLLNRLLTIKTIERLRTKIGTEIINQIKLIDTTPTPRSSEFTAPRPQPIEEAEIPSSRTEGIPTPPIFTAPRPQPIEEAKTPITKIEEIPALSGFTATQPQSIEETEIPIYVTEETPATNRAAIKYTRPPHIDIEHAQLKIPNRIQTPRSQSVEDILKIRKRRAEAEKFNETTPQPPARTGRRVFAEPIPELEPVTVPVPTLEPTPRRKKRETMQGRPQPSKPQAVRPFIPPAKHPPEQPPKPQVKPQASEKLTPHLVRPQIPPTPIGAPTHNSKKTNTLRGVIMRAQAENNPTKGPTAQDIAIEAQWQAKLKLYAQTYGLTVERLAKEAEKAFKSSGGALWKTNNSVKEAFILLLSTWEQNIQGLKQVLEKYKYSNYDGIDNFPTTLLAQHDAYIKMQNTISESYLFRQNDEGKNLNFDKNAYVKLTNSQDSIECHIKEIVKTVKDNYEIKNPEIYRKEDLKTRLDEVRQGEEEKNALKRRFQVMPVNKPQTGRLGKILKIFGIK